MPQALLGLAIAIAICFLFFGALVGALMAIPGLLLGVVAALVVRFWPTSFSNDCAQFVRAADYVKVVGADLPISVSGKVVRFAFVVAIALSPLLLAMYTGEQVNPLIQQYAHQRGEDIALAWVAYVVTWAVTLIGSTMMALAAIDGAEAKPSPKTPAYERRVKHLDQLISVQTETSIRGYRKVDYRGRDFLADFDSHLRVAKTQLLDHRWDTTDALAAALLAQAAADLRALVTVEQCLIDTEVASNEATAAAKKARNLDLRERAKECAEKLNSLRYAAVSPQSVGGLESVPLRALQAELTGISGASERLYQERRDQSRNQWQGSAHSAQQKQQETTVPLDVVKALATLGLSADATYQQARAQYRHLRGIYHPDRGSRHANEEKFKNVQLAWERVDAYFSEP